VLSERVKFEGRFGKVDWPEHECWEEAEEVA
jgi:hypothetical protein